jgi:transcriptional antiterminator NusG
MSDHAWHVVKNTPKVTGFVGAGASRRRSARTESRSDSASRCETAAEKPEARSTCSKRASRCGSTKGPFTSFNGEDDRVNLDPNTLKVKVDDLGRSTPVELDSYRWRNLRFRVGRVRSAFGELGSLMRP